ATGVNDLEVLLQWNNNAQGSTGTEIQILGPDSVWRTIGQVDPGVHTFLVRDADGWPTKFLAYQDYDFRIAATTQDSHGNTIEATGWATASGGPVQVGDTGDFNTGDGMQ